MRHANPSTDGASLHPHPRTKVIVPCRLSQPTKLAIDRVLTESWGSAVAGRRNRMSTLRSVRAVSPRRGGMARELPCARTFSDSVSPGNLYAQLPPRAADEVVAARFRLLSAATARLASARLGCALPGAAVITKENS